MEKPANRNSNIQTLKSGQAFAVNPAVITILKNKFTFFVLGFVALIILSNYYNHKPERIKSVAVIADIDRKDETNSYEIVDYAKSLLGERYTPAGKSPSEGFDCSGFTQYVYKNFSIEIPPSSITQAAYGKTVDISDAKEGDLIFFKSPTIGNNNIGHVGIIVSTADETILFIHSSTSRGVVIDSLESDHYKARFRSIKRVI
jgi:cell wall-associated NlpC family hydrolase